jgi:hypothetical protein
MRARKLGFTFGFRSGRKERKSCIAMAFFSRLLHLFLATLLALYPYILLRRGWVCMYSFFSLLSPSTKKNGGGAFMDLHPTSFSMALLVSQSVGWSAGRSYLFGIVSGILPPLVLSLSDHQKWLICTILTSLRRRLRNLKGRTERCGSGKISVFAVSHAMEWIGDALRVGIYTVSYNQLDDGTDRMRSVFYIHEHCWCFTVLMCIYHIVSSLCYYATFAVSDSYIIRRYASFMAPQVNYSTVLS